MKRLLIVGAGGFGREVLDWALAVSPARDWEIGGFLDANPNALIGFGCGLHVVGDPSSYAPTEDDRFLCAVGDPATKLRLCRGLRSRGGQFINLVHPTVILGSNHRLGQGCVLCPYAVLTTHVTLGDYVIVNVHALVGHDATLGDGCTLNGHANVAGCSRLGEGSFLGSHAAVLQGAVVGEYATVGAGSVVLRKVPAHATVMGVPARQVYGFEES